MLELSPEEQRELRKTLGESGAEQGLAAQEPPAGIPWSLADVGYVAVASVPTIILFVLIRTSALARLTSPVARPVALALFTALFYAALIGVIYVVAIRRYSAGWGMLGLRSFSVWRAVAWAVGGWVALRAFLLVYGLILQGVFKYTVPLDRRVPRIFGTTRIGMAMAITVAVLVAPVAEEIIFRGFVYGALRKALGVWPGIAASGAVFALAHLQPVLFVPILAIGMALAYLYERTKSLGASMTLHALNNLVSVITVYYLTKGV